MHKFEGSRTKVSERICCGGEEDGKMLSGE